MDSVAFRRVFDGIRDLDSSEGPSRNIFQPKFDAREQALTLRRTLVNCLVEDPTSDIGARAVGQLCRVTAFLAVNLHETEEDKEAVTTACAAYDLVACVAAGDATEAKRLVQVPHSQPPVGGAAPPCVQPAVTTVESLLRTDVPIVSDANEFRGVALYTETLNCLGIILSSCVETSQNASDARKVLGMAEDVYLSWCKHSAKSTADGTLPTYQSLPLTPDGKLAPERSEAEFLVFDMEQNYTSTLYFLAQCFGLLRDTKLSSKYCHLTLSKQLQSRKEFDRKVWAGNALVLSGFYAGEAQWALAMHCLEAGRNMMPTQPADEETLGSVAWHYGKFHKGRLRHAAARFVEGNAAHAGPMPEPLEFSEWWVNFDLPIPPPTPLPCITDFDSAREEFKKANAYLQEATKYFVFEGCCTDYINIQKDVCELYALLAVFESDLPRRIAMHQRRLDLLKPFPDQLSFQAYGTLVRQLLFDCGDIAGEILDMRIKQFKERIGTPLSEKKIGELAITAQTYFTRFIATFHDKDTGKMPKGGIDRELHVPVFRALMRVASLEAKHFSRTPQEEYERIGRTATKYEECIAFAVANKLDASDSEVAPEVRLAREMVQLLPSKQKEVYRAYAGRTA